MVKFDRMEEKLKLFQYFKKGKQDDWVSVGHLADINPI